MDIGSILSQYQPTSLTAHRILRSIFGIWRNTIRTRKLPHTDVEVSCLGFGLSGLPSWSPGPIRNEDVDAVERLMRSAFETGITLFDTASPYALGRSESVMGRVFKQAPELRAKSLVQTKCGQIICDDDGNPVPPRIDLSRNEIISSAERSLRRLCIDRLDILLLHQPTPLMQADEIAEAFAELSRCGKVRHFGLSNFTATQSTMIQRVTEQRLVINQVQISLFNPRHILDGMGATLSILEHLDLVHQRLIDAAPEWSSVRRWMPPAEGLLDYCQSEGILIQARSPLRHRLPGAYQPLKNFGALDSAIEHIARELGSTPSAVALAWLLKHPGGIVPIMSTSNADHLIENAKAVDITLTDQDSSPDR